MFLASASLAFAGFDDQSASIDAEIGGLSDGIHGVAWLDYDRDGDLDLFHPNGFGLPAHLWRNDGAGAFTDVGAESGAAVETGNTGALAADLDGDGWTDLLLTSVGVLYPRPSPPRLLRNLGDGTFADATEASGLLAALPDGSMAATAADIDGDGDLDLFVTVAGNPPGPLMPPPALLVNEGGRFVDRTAESGILADPFTCVAMFVQLDDDDAVDLVSGTCSGVEAQPLRIYHGDGDGHFTDQAAPRRVWEPGYWMGLAAGDFDGDGRVDLFATDIGYPGGLAPALYLDQGSEYRESASASGLPIELFAWGTTGADFDDDGVLDLFEAGGGGPAFLTMKNPTAWGTLGLGRGDGTFDPAPLGVDLVGRAMSGVAAADYDGDGYPDLAVAGGPDPVSHAHGRPVLLHNQGGHGGWLTVRLDDPTSPNRAAIGARVEVSARGVVQQRQVLAGGSFASTESPWPTFGLGDADQVQVTVRWPDGEREDFGRLATGQAVDLIRGSASACATPAEGCSTAPMGRGGWVVLLLGLARRRCSS